MHILIITLHYEPDLGPSAPMFTNLSQTLQQKGHQVTVVAAVPHYPSGEVPANYLNGWIKKSWENGVRIIRVRLPSLRRSDFNKRFLQYASFQVLSTLATLTLAYDVALISNPAIVTWLPFTWHRIFRRKPIIFSVMDVYPDVGIKLGIFRNPTLTKLVASLEYFCLHHSTKIHMIADSFRPGLLRSGVEIDKLSLIYVWVDTHSIQPLSKNSQLSKDFDLSEKFVVLYAGNLGLSQGLDLVINVAERLESDSEIQFIFIGDGGGKAELEAKVAHRKLSNIRFIPFQPKEKLSEVLACGDISLVVLKRGVSSDSIPSKTFSIMASGRPIIASVDEQCETALIITRAQAGICIPPEDPTSLVEAIVELKHSPDLRAHLGSNGRAWVEQHHSPASAAEQFEALFSSSISKKLP